MSDTQNVNPVEPIITDEEFRCEQCDLIWLETYRYDEDEDLCTDCKISQLQQRIEELEETVLFKRFKKRGDRISQLEDALGKIDKSHDGWFDDAVDSHRCPECVNKRSIAQSALEEQNGRPNKSPSSTRQS